MHQRIQELSLLLTIVGSVGFGLLAQVLAYRWRIPAIVLLLICGVALGPDGIGLVKPAALGDGLAILVKLAVAVILFEGALNLRFTMLRNSVAEVRNLITLGVLISWGLTALVAHYVVRLEWSLAVLFGAVMTVTGPTVVQPLLKRINIGRRIKTTLEGEAILIDPIGAILAVAVLDVILGLSGNHPVGILSALWSYFGRIVIGMGVGGLLALALSRILRLPHLVPSELSNLVVLAGVWVSFGLAEGLQSEAGIMASVAMGLVLQREAVPGERQLRHFKETLTTLSISVLFVLLAANLSLDVLWAAGVRGIMTIILIMFMVRPISVFLSTWLTNLNWREKVFIAWVCPRGIVAASVASFLGLTLHEAGITDAERLPALTFLAILMTVTIQGLTASPLARLLGLESMAGRGVVIAGANRLGREVAGLLQAHGRPVTLIDTNSSHVNKARSMGLNAVQGNALDEYILEQAGIDDAETIVAMTSNPEVNVLTSQFVHDVFGIKRAFPMLRDPDKGADVNILRHTGSRMAFGKPVDPFMWELARTQQFTWEIPSSWTHTPLGCAQIPDELLPAIRLRDKNAEIVYLEQDWKSGDSIVFLTSIPVEQAVERLAALSNKKPGAQQT